MNSKARHRNKLNHDSNCAALFGTRTVYLRTRIGRFFRVPEISGAEKFLSEKACGIGVTWETAIKFASLQAGVAARFLSLFASSPWCSAAPFFVSVPPSSSGSVLSVVSDSRTESELVCRHQKLSITEISCWNSKSSCNGGWMDQL
jgi:hypothetical protein